MRNTLLLLIAIASLPAFASDDTFVDRENGVALVKPQHWEISPPLPKQNSNQKQRIVEIAKYPAGHEGPTPTFIMWLQPMPFSARGLAPVAMLRQIIPNLGRALEDLELESPPHEVPVWDLNRISKLNGAEMRIRYTAHDANGRAYVARSRMMYVRRGDQLYSIQTTSPASGPDESTAELEDLISSIRIAR